MRILSALTLMVFAVTAHAGEMAWSKDYATASKSAKASNKLVMIDFYTDWCGWCKKLDKDTYTNAAVIDASKKFVVLKSNAEKEGKDLAAKYKVTGFPTIVFADADGNLVAQVAGYQTPPDFMRLLKNVANVPSGLPKAKAAIAAGTATGEDYANAAVLGAIKGAKVEELTSDVAKLEELQYTGPLLAEAYSAAGDALQTAGKNKDAIAMFKKAIASTKDAGIQSYAYVSMIFTYQADKDPAGAKQATESLKALPGATKEWLAILGGASAH